MDDERKEELVRKAVAQFVVEKKGESYTGHDYGRTREDGTHANDLMQLSRRSAETVIGEVVGDALKEADVAYRFKLDIYERFSKRVAQFPNDDELRKILQGLNAELEVHDRTYAAPE